MAEAAKMLLQEVSPPPTRLAMALHRLTDYTAKRLPPRPIGLTTYHTAPPALCYFPLNRSQQHRRRLTSGATSPKSPGSVGAPKNMLATQARQKPQQTAEL